MALPGPPTAAGPWIYFADNGNLSINRIRWDGSGLEVLANTRPALLGLTIDASAKQLYWSDNPREGFAQLHRSDLTGGNPEILYQALLPNQAETIGQLAVDDAAGHVYWIDGGQDRIRRMDLDGSGLINILPDGGRLGTALELDSAFGHIYFGSGDFGNAFSKIERINLDGTGREIIAHAYAYFSSTTSAIEYLEATSSGELFSRFRWIRVNVMICFQ